MWKILFFPLISISLNGGVGTLEKKKKRKEKNQNKTESSNFEVLAKSFF